jgi:hypothetical protein
VLSTATLNISHDPSARGSNFLALDGTLVVPELECPTTGFKVGPLVVCDAITISINPGKGAPYKAAERALPVYLVGEPWEGDAQDEPDQFSGF